MLIVSNQSKGAGFLEASNNTMHENENLLCLLFLHTDMGCTAAATESALNSAKSNIMFFFCFFFKAKTLTLKLFHVLARQVNDGL